MSVSFWLQRDGRVVASEEVVAEVLAGRWVWVGDVCIGSDQPGRYVGIVKDGNSQYSCLWGEDQRAAAEQAVERAKPRNAMTRPLPIANEPLIDGRTVREHIEGFIRSATTPHARVIANELMRLQQVERGCGDAVAVLARLSDHFQVRDRSSAASVLVAVMEAFARVEAEREDLRTRLSAAQQITGGVP